MFSYRSGVATVSLGTFIFHDLFFYAFYLSSRIKCLFELGFGSSGHLSFHMKQNTEINYQLSGNYLFINRESRQMTKFI